MQFVASLSVCSLCIEYHDSSKQSHPYDDELSLEQREKQSFPWILYSMLERSDNIHLTDIISFQPHGRSIKIHNRNRFQSEILHRYFPKQSTIASFLRQLSLYGFLRLMKDGPDQNSYYHEMFLQGRPDLMYVMKRTVNKENTFTEPDFYAMAPIQSLAPPSTVNDAADRNSVPNPPENCCQHTNNSKPAHQSRQNIQLSDFDASTLRHPIIPSTSQNDILTVNRNSNAAEFLHSIPPSNATIPCSEPLNTSLLTLPQPYSDTTNTTMASNTNAASAGTTEWCSTSTFSPATLPAAYYPTTLPVERNQHLQSIFITNDNHIASLPQSPHTSSDFPRFHAAMQLYNETLDEYYKVLNQLLVSQQLATQQQRTTNYYTNESTDHQRHLLFNQEERQIEEQHGHESVSHYSPNTERLDFSPHVTRNNVNDGNDNTNARSSTAAAYNNNDGRYFDTSGGGPSMTWGNNNNHDQLDDDGTISDESLNRDWGMQNNG